MLKIENPWLILVAVLSPKALEAAVVLDNKLLAISVICDVVICYRASQLFCTLYA